MHNSNTLYILWYPCLSCPCCNIFNPASEKFKVRHAFVPRRWFWIVFIGMSALIWIVIFRMLVSMSWISWCAACGVPMWIIESKPRRTVRTSPLIGTHNIYMRQTFILCALLRQCGGPWTSGQTKCGVPDWECHAKTKLTHIDTSCHVYMQLWLKLKCHLTTTKRYVWATILHIRVSSDCTSIWEQIHYSSLN